VFKDQVIRESDLVDIVFVSLLVESVIYLLDIISHGWDMDSVTHFDVLVV